MEHNKLILYKANMMHAFTRSAAKPKGWSGNDFHEAVIAERPDLQGQTAYIAGRGAFGFAIFIGGEVFKMPLSRDTLAYFDREIETLRKLEGKGLPVPRVTCVGEKAHFFGMTRMPGVRLTLIAQKMTRDEKLALAEDIAGVIIGLAKAVPPVDGKYFYHDDLNSGNVLVDPQTKRLTAVIDFGSTGYRPLEDIAKNKLYDGIGSLVKSACAFPLVRRKAWTRGGRGGGGFS